MDRKLYVVGFIVSLILTMLIPGVLKPFMLTGDNVKVAKWVADELKLDGYFAEVLPCQKSRIFKRSKF